MISVPGLEPYPLYGEGVPAECRIASLESQGEPVSPFDRELLKQQQADRDMSATDAEATAQGDRELQESLSEFEEILEEAERLGRNRSSLE